MRTKILKKKLDRWCTVILVGMGAWLSGCGKPTPEELFLEGKQLMQQQNFASARKRFEKLLEEYPDFELASAIRVHIADCFNQEGFFDDAKAIYSSIVAEETATPAAWMSHIRLGDMARFDQDWETAENQFRGAIASTTETSRILRAMENLAQTFLDGQDREKAIETYHEMTEFCETPAQRLRAAQVLTNLYFSADKPEEAWASIVDIKNATGIEEMLPEYYTSVMETAASLDKFDEGLRFLDSQVSSTTDEDKAALALYFKAHLASVTAPFRATAVATLKELHDRLPKTGPGRWAGADAAVIIMRASDEFANAVQEASALFGSTLKSYDDIIDNVTIEWFEPQKAAMAWLQLAKAHEYRGIFLENVADLKAASADHAEIVKRFKDYLPSVAEQSRAYIQGLSQEITEAEADPEKFWTEARRFRMGRTLVEEASPEASILSATPEIGVPVEVPVEGVIESPPNAGSQPNKGGNGVPQPPDR